MLICTYSLSSGSWLNIINHCFVWRCLASFHLPSFWRRRSKLPYSFQFVPNFVFVSIDCDNFLLCVIKHRTALTNYCPVLTFYLSHSKTDSSLLLLLKGFYLWLIVCFVNTSFHIHFPFFISWKQNITFIPPTCFRWSADFFDMNLVKEYKLGGCQWRKLGSVVTWWYMPYFHLFPFVFSKKYGEGEISRVVIFVSV